MSTSEHRRIVAYGPRLGPPDPDGPDDRAAMPIPSDGSYFRRLDAGVIVVARSIFPAKVAQFPNGFQVFTVHHDRLITFRAKFLIYSTPI